MISKWMTKKSFLVVISFILTMALIDSCEIDPMIGMEGLTPYDFI